MSKRLGWVPALVLLAVGCNNDVGPSVTPDEQEAIRQAHSATQRQGTEAEFKYLVWEGTTVMDAANNPVRVVRVKFRVGASKEASDILYRFADGKLTHNRLNGSGDHWQPEAQVWVRGKP